MRNATQKSQIGNELLYWLAPAMAREGLIKNDSWIPQACSRAVQLFSQEDLHLPATVLAALDEGAIDYIAQAPVLVVAATAKADLSRAKDRELVAGRFKAACAARPRLKDLMRQYGLALQLRALSGHALRREHLPLLEPLSTIAPSPLAQAIPGSAEDQARWLSQLQALRSHLRLHGRSDWFVAWAAVNLRDAAAWRYATELADFARHLRSRFDRSWSFTQARAASERWHCDIARRSVESRYSAAQLAEIADYAPLPVEAEFDGYTFHALRTRPAIFEEGACMHHCVATYVETVFARQCWLYSVQRGGQRIATLEVRLARPVPGRTARFLMPQIKGPFNRAPPVEALKAADKLVTEINRIAVEPGQLAPMPRDRPAPAVPDHLRERLRHVLVRIAG